MAGWVQSATPAEARACAGEDSACRAHSAAHRLFARSLPTGNGRGGGDGGRGRSLARLVARPRCAGPGGDRRVARFRRRDRRRQLREDRGLGVSAPSSLGDLPLAMLVLLAIAAVLAAPL